MNVKQIRELAEIAKANGLTELEYEEGETRIRLVRQSGVSADLPISAALSMPATQAVPDLHGGVDFNRATEIKSSLIGVFYASPAPDAEPFVKVGSRVEQGDVLCIIEAMKLMNEIVAEQGGEIVDVCVQSGDVVEFGQTLFKIC